MYPKIDSACAPLRIAKLEYKVSPKTVKTFSGAKIGVRKSHLKIGQKWHILGVFGL